VVDKGFAVGDDLWPDAGCEQRFLQRTHAWVVLPPSLLPLRYRAPGRLRRNV